MGAVYKAKQPQLDRVVALKILSHDLASDPAFAERFNREARVLARLNHPNIVGIFDYGTAGLLCYLLMEYVDGVNLRQAMQAGQFSPSESLAMVEEICSALKFAHEEGILHRDIKPENVLIDSKGRVKIADFGIAKLVGEGERTDVTLTMHGSVLGSPHYMAPEQIETPDDVDQRADIYSLGVVFYELLTGELPIGRFALPSEKVSMDTRIDEIVMRTLEKERQARFQSAEEVMTQVGVVAQSPEAARTAHAQVQSDDPGTARFSLLSAILTGCSVILALAFLFVMNTGDHQVVSAATEAESIASGLIPTFILLFLAAGSAICGFFMGVYALTQIRRSGGEKDGLGSSVFAVVVWPILFLWALSILFLSMPMPDSGGGREIGFMILLLFTGVSLILATFVLVRGLRRWARGVVSKDGEKRFPGIGRTILASIGVVILGMVLLEVSSRVFPGSGQGDYFTEMEQEMAREESRYLSGGFLSESKDIEWYRGAPEMVFPIEMYPAMQADFRLVRYDAEGKPEEDAEIGSLLGVSGSGMPITSFVRIGTSGAKGEGRGAERGFTCSLDFTGQKGSLLGESDLSGWEFDPDPISKGYSKNLGNSNFLIATRTVLVDGVKKQVASLRLEVKVIKRPWK